MHLSQASFTGDRQGLGDRDYCIAGESSRERAPLPKGTEKENFSLRESDTPQQTKRAISLLAMFWGSPTGDRQSEV
jgi:hypothetical protein